MTVRFAPSPTGRFHLGNLRTAWLSHRLAREWGLQWWVRFEDIDAPRVIAGAQEQQLADLASLGLVPDRVEVQSKNHEAHWQGFLRAQNEGVIFPCTCSRKEVEEELARAASAPNSGVIFAGYPGTCLKRGTAETLAAHPAGRSIAWRWTSHPVVIARTGARFEPAYHWACAIDDARLEPEHEILVRGADLAQAAPIQRSIQLWFRGKDYTPPAILHASMITANDGSRLEKRTQGVTLPELFSRGLTPSTLLERFEHSIIDRALLTRPVRGTTLFETRQSLTERELLGPT